MADYERRNNNNNYRGGFNRKRRYRDDDDFDRRNQRRRIYEEPAHVKLQKQLLSLADSPLRKAEDEIVDISKAMIENADNAQVQDTFLELTSQIILEQPLKIPFVAATLLAVDKEKPDITTEVLKRVSSSIQEHLAKGAWRETKLQLRFIACLQGILEGDGIFSILDEIFSRAVDLQTASSEDGLGLELVKIILLTMAYAMASSAKGFEEQANALLEKTDIIASTPHTLEVLVNPYPDSEEIQAESVISLLQRQMQNEANTEWPLSCIPRPWKALTGDETADDATEIRKHKLPTIDIPATVVSTIRPRLPEIYFTAYSDQEVETVPRSSNLASSIVRDVLVDTINMMDYNRNAAAKFLIELDSYFAPGTFVKRATPFDKLKELEASQSTWKPEDVAIDAVFSQLFQLPMLEQKAVYYHVVLRESCMIAPAAIAPSLGRAIRYLYKNVDTMDLELGYRFMDWFSHHLSNFGFTWKWTEWVDDVELPKAHAKKAFIVGALDKEIRLSFAQRIRGTLPIPYQALITEAKEQDTPEFKYNSDQTPYAEQGKEILRLLRVKAPDSELEKPITALQDVALEQGLADPNVPSTDALVTSICFLGSKSFSHVLSCIERTKDRLLSIGSTSEPARLQIISSVMQYWSEKPGIGVNLVDKLLNYTILTPMSVIEWALVENLDQGRILMHAHIYEMISGTLHKVTTRIRQVVQASRQPGLPQEQKTMLEETLAGERNEARKLYELVDDALKGIEEGSADSMAESKDADSEDMDMLRLWGRRWRRVFKRKSAVEESWIEETLVLPIPEFEEPVIAAAPPSPAAAGNGASNGPANGSTGEGVDVELDDNIE
ncbi:hypothetical protein MMC25_006456 [Agyrium rufum]|nr:hypothetical protein [Agyrium rufum]